VRDACEFQNECHRGKRFAVANVTRYSGTKSETTVACRTCRVSGS
jgi:hypothetical protein